MSKIFNDAKKIPVLAMILAESTLTEDDLLYEAENILVLYHGDENMFAEELYDDDIEVKKGAMSEMKALQKFVRKYKK